MAKEEVNEDQELFEEVDKNPTISEEELVDFEEEMPQEVVEEEVAEVEVEVEAPVAAAASEKFPVRVDLSRLKFEAKMRNSQSVAVVQRVLNELGYMDARRDRPGWLSSGTSEALRAFQGDAGLPVTGQADGATVEALLAASPTIYWDRS